MPLSYADAIKRHHGEKRSQETSKFSSPNGELRHEHIAGTTAEPSFRDIGTQKVRNNSKQEKSPKEQSLSKKSKGNGSAPALRRTWKNIAEKKVISSGFPILEQTSAVKHTNGRKGKRKDITGNASANPQKSSKPKPSLLSVSISDLIAPAAKTRGRKGSVEPVAVRPKSSKSQANSTAVKWGAPDRWPTVKETNRVDQTFPDVKSKTTANKKQIKKRGANSDAASSLSAIFLAPRGYDERAQDGEEHQLLRLMQERTVYKKKGRQRVAPRKKKLTALKKKVLQERLKKWHERYPVDVLSAGKVKNNRPTDIPERGGCQSVCLYHFVDSADLEDDDEFEEVEQNLQEMASKVAEVDRVMVPRGLDRCGEYPVFVRFKTVEGALAAKACWDGLVIAGDELSVVFIDDSELNENSDWPAEMISAERRGAFKQIHNAASQPENEKTAILIEDVLSQDDYDDSDCMEESLSFLKHAAAKYTDVAAITPCGEGNGNVVLFCTGGSSSAQTVVRGLSSTVVAGKALSVSLLDASCQTLDSMPLSYIIVENLLTQDDFDDTECLEETLRDVKELIEKHVSVIDIRTEGISILIYFMGNDASAQDAVDEMNGLVLGGAAVSAHIKEIIATPIFLRNALSKDDMDDDDCLQESLNDIRQIVSKYGEISGLNATRDRNIVLVDLVPGSIQKSMNSIVAELNGTVIGGQIISASSPLVRTPHVFEKMSLEGKHTPPEEIQSGLEAKKPIYSGDKLLPEFFAECKRVPKIPNSSGPRNYAQVTNDERVRPLLTEMLGELMRLQKRAIEDKNAKSRRRLVMGLREVFRGIRAHKVKLVVMANNLDEYGGTTLVSFKSNTCF